MGSSFRNGRWQKRMQSNFIQDQERGLTDLGLEEEN